jgi:molybdate transport system regulatory protein
MTRLVLQLHFDPQNRIGPGKIELLERIDETGSISAAGRAMDMSYRRAWLLVDAMNRTFNAPVVATRFGGTSVGRAKLTPLGREVVKLYREIGEVAEVAAKAKVTRLEHLISQGKKRPPSKGDEAKAVGKSDQTSRATLSSQGSVDDLRGRHR